MANERRTLRELYKKADTAAPTAARYGRNLNLCYLDRKLDPCYNREEMLRAIQRTLLRKNKPNVLLTGIAGCGKTAIAEGLAAFITQSRLQYLADCEKAISEQRERMKEWESAGSVGEEPKYQSPPKPLLCDCVIYDVSLNAMVGGTKYRGEFEERIQALINECRDNRDIILFVDEVHCLVRAGATEDNGSGAGQILKPALARGDVRMIGATTTEEKAVILKDKALARRFYELEIAELKDKAAMDTARGILKHYCAYHKVKTDVSADELMTQIKFHLPDTVFPDNFINVVDDTLAGARLDGETAVGRKQFYATLSRLSGHIILLPEGPTPAKVD